MARKIGVRTIVRIRQVKVDRLSTDPAANPAEVAIEGCAILPRSTFEQGKGWVITEDMQVFAPYGSDVQAKDRVRLPDGTVWNVDGQPGNYENKRGIEKAMIINLTRVSQG